MVRNQSLTSYSFLTGAALQATNAYLPLYGYEAVGLSTVSAGLLAGVTGGVGLLSRIVWGRATERLRAPKHGVLVVASGAATGVLAILLAAHVREAWLLWSGAAIFGATGLAANVVLMIAAVKSVPPSLAGTASGLLAIGLYSGFTLGPISFGHLVDTTGGYATGWLAVGSVYLMTAALTLADRR